MQAFLWVLACLSATAASTSESIDPSIGPSTTTTTSTTEVPTTTQPPTPPFEQVPVTFHQSNSRAVSQASRHRKNPHIDILDVNVPASGDLTFDIDCEAHDQNQWGRCSKLRLTYFAPGGAKGFSVTSGVVPRSSQYRAFSFKTAADDTARQVEKGGQLKLTGVGCWGAGIYVRNTKAAFKVIATSSSHLGGTGVPLTTSTTEVPTTTVPVTFHQSNSRAVSQASRHRKNPHIDILDVNVPASGDLTFDIDCEAHDQNQWGRCSKLRLTYFAPDGAKGFSVTSGVVPRSSQYRAFSFKTAADDTARQVEEGGQLKLTGVGCWGAGIYVRNTKAAFKVIATSSSHLGGTGATPTVVAGGSVSGTIKLTGFDMTADPSFKDMLLAAVHSALASFVKEEAGDESFKSGEIEFALNANDDTEDDVGTSTVEVTYKVEGKDRKQVETLAQAMTKLQATAENQQNLVTLIKEVAPVDARQQLASLQLASVAADSADASPVKVTYNYAAAPGDRGANASHGNIVNETFNVALYAGIGAGVVIMAIAAVIAGVAVQRRRKRRAIITAKATIVGPSGWRSSRAGSSKLPIAEDVGAVPEATEVVDPMMDKV